MPECTEKSLNSQHLDKNTSRCAGGKTKQPRLIRTVFHSDLKEKKSGSVADQGVTSYYHAHNNLNRVPLTGSIYITANPNKLMRSSQQVTSVRAFQLDGVHVLTLEKLDL